jgi:hypothetical protein
MAELLGLACALCSCREASRSGKFGKKSRAVLVLCWLAGALCFAVRAYPPAPDHLFYGMVRNEMGIPLTDSSAQLIFEVGSGAQIMAKMRPGMAPGINYALSVPMDCGITEELYKATALRPTMPFKIRIKLGKVMYLPIEMKGDLAKVGQPGERTRLDLTLGEDANGNGIPDAWERAFLALYGLKEVNPTDHLNGNSMSVMDQYLAGTYEYKDSDGFQLRIVASTAAGAKLEFMTIRGHTYTIQGSVDCREWQPVQFSFPSAGSDAATLDHYYAADTQVVHVEAVTAADAPAMKFFKLMVQ